MPYIGSYPPPSPRVGVGRYSEFCLQHRLGLFCLVEWVGVGGGGGGGGGAGERVEFFTSQPTLLSFEVASNDKHHENMPI